MAGGHSHRSGLNKDKKPFKSRHATKGQLKNKHKGKVEKSSNGGTNKPNKTLSKLERKNIAKQLKESKILETKEIRKVFEGAQGTDKIVTILCLTDDISPADIAEKILQNNDISNDMDTFAFTIPSVTSLKVNRFKSNLKIIIPDPTNLLSILDACRISDFVILGISASKEVEQAYGETILRSIISQGIASVIGVFPNLVSAYPKRNLQMDIRQSLESFFRHFFPNEDKLYALESESECLGFVRYLCQKFPKSVTWRDQRGYIVAEGVEWDNNQGEGLLVVEGTVRGAGFNSDRLVHIPNFGDFQIDHIIKTTRKGEDTIFAAKNPESLEELNQDEMEMDAEEWENDDYEEEFGVRMTDKRYFDDDGSRDLHATKKALPKGTSNYQGKWYLDDVLEGASDLEDEDEQEEEDEMVGMEDADVDNATTNYEPTEAGEESEMFVELSPEEEARQYEDFKNSADDDLEWPDEIELDPRESAKDVLAKFRGIKSLGNCEWDYDEHDTDAPSVWKRLLRVQNYKATRNRLVKEAARDAQVNLGDKCRIYIRAPGHIFDAVKDVDERPFVVYSLLEHEHKQAPVNFSFESWEDYEEPIASRESLIVQYGPRRYEIEPIFNQASNNANNVHKFERFHHPGTMSIVTCIAPVLFNSAPTIFFKRLENGSVQPVGQGTFLNSDHTRVVAERAVLTGHAVKIHKKLVTVRYMFFNSEDINWFKAVPLFTKLGRSGFIKESLGTHGYFKATFDGKLTAQDVIGMSLYKRVWPQIASTFVAE